MLAIVTDSDRLQSWLVGLGYWGPVGIISLIAVAVVINPIPSAPIALASGAAFGHTWGTIYVVAGAGAGALGAFWIARLLGYELMKSVFGKHLKLGWMGSQNTLMAMVFVSRLIPFLSFDLVSYGAGLTPIKTWRFILATVAGLIPASFLLAHFGGELTAASLDEVLLTVLLLGGLTLVPVIINYTVRWRRRSAIDRINESSNRSPVIGKK
ncbi:MAG: VTT domain-containing protein [Candidatus Thiodiazotropha sp. (ex Epidulcina cf. delphinae)]|nr:VTT domain-containing protein [Candidatus Thiodiazotropha sp. (ex Epidulcina cf. delphinae)]